MALTTENGPYLGYYFGENVYSFKEVEEKITVEAGPLLSSERITATLAETTFTKHPIPTTHNWSKKLSIQWLLEEGYVPLLKGRTVRFYPMRPGTSEADSQKTLPLLSSPSLSSSSSSSSSTASSSSSSSSSSTSQTTSHQPTTPSLKQFLTGIEKSRMIRAHHYIDQAITHYRTQIALMNADHPAEVTCPITLELMKDPVIDEHGHTFDRQAIEQWMQSTPPIHSSQLDMKGPIINDHDHPFDRQTIEHRMESTPPIHSSQLAMEDSSQNKTNEVSERPLEEKDHQATTTPRQPRTCPLSNEPLTQQLKTNLALKAIVEQLWNNPPIPLLPTMTGKPFTQNDAIVKPMLTAAQQFSTANDPTNAIQMLTAAFSYTGKSEDYELLPHQYITLKAPQKAILAYLYLGRLKLAEGKTQEAIHTFEEALKQAPDEEHLQATYAASRLGTPEAATDFRTLALRRGRDTPRAEKEALHFWETALLSHPQRGDLYEEIIPLTTQIAQMSLYLKGMLELHQEDPTQAARLYQRATKLEPSNALPHLARLSRLEETHPHRFEVTSRLTPTQQIYYLQQSLNKAFQEIARSNQEINRLRAKVFPSIPLTPVAPLLPIPPLEPAQAFGASEWSRYFGEVGVEPPLPPNIEEILGTRCPFWPSKTIRETHLLVLVPKTVNGRALTLDYLGELIQNPKNGGSATKYNHYSRVVQEQEGGKSLGASQWMLMTRDVMPRTRGRSYIVQGSSFGSRLSGMRLMRGGVPTLLEAVTAVLMHYVRTGERLYSDSPWTYTRCQEVVSGFQATVGCFGAAGLSFGFNYDCQSIGLACSWKF